MFEIRHATRDLGRLAGGFVLLLHIACSSTAPLPDANLPSTENPVYLADGRVLTEPAGYVAPKLIRRVEPNYSEDLRTRGLQGAVVLSGIIGEDGSVKDLRVVQSGGRDLDKEAIRAVAQWKYEAATLQGQKVATVGRFSVSFFMTGK